MRLGSWVLLPRGLLSRHQMPFSHRGRAVAAKERVVVRERRRMNVSGKSF